MIKYKTDDEYGIVEFPNDRKLPDGHDISLSQLETNPDLMYDGIISTDVKIIKFILDNYFDTSTIESTAKSSMYKLDFSTVFLDTIYQILLEKQKTVASHISELDKQLNDISHRIIRPHLLGQSFTQEEKMEIFDLLENIQIQRRMVKDTGEILRVTLNGILSARNQIVALDKRHFTPKSERFKNDDEFAITNDSNSKEFDD